MRLSSWLTKLYRRLTIRTNQGGIRRQRKSSAAGSANIERLEPRRLMTTGVAAVGFETRVNSYTPASQQSPAIAVGATGDYVVTWQSYEQDGSGQGIYFQRYNAAGTAQGSEIRANTFTTASQTSPSVAMDGTGNFVITWQSYGQDGSGAGIYAKRFDSTGNPISGDFQINTYTTGSQGSPSIAMDPGGDFVVTWQSYGQDGDAFGVFAKRYNSSGTAQGTEFRVNTDTTHAQSFPSAAMDATGDFVIAWQSDGQDGSNLGIEVQQYNSAGIAQGTEFTVNSFTTLNQQHPSAAMDATGNFVIAWESNGQDGSSYGVYARRYSAIGSAQGNEFKVNSFTTGSQSSASVAMDAAGDFVVTWESDLEDGSNYGVYAQRYSALGLALDVPVRVNTFTTDFQDYPAVSMDTAGDFVVTWQSFLQDSSSDGIYSQRYVATVGPIVTAVLEGTGPRVIQNGDRLTSSVDLFSVDFSDNMNAGPGANSVVNKANWVLTRYGIDLSNRITGIQFGFNAVTNRYVATISIAPSLTEGVYQLVAKQTINDLNGRTLDGDDNGIAGGNFLRNFAVAATLAAGPETRVNTYTTDKQRDPSAAMDAAGDYVTVWDSKEQDGGSYGVYGQRFNAAGVTQGSEFRVNSSTLGSQNSPSVAMDAAGSFVVTWEGYVSAASGNDIFGQRFNVAGAPLGISFQVNTYTTSEQRDSKVAMDAAGDFVVTWTSLGQDGSKNGIFGRRFNSIGLAQGGDFQVNSFTTAAQHLPTVAMDAVGDFVIAWESENQVGNGYGIFAQRYDTAGITQGSEFLVSAILNDGLHDPSVAMNATGDFVIAWDSESSHSVFANQYGADGRIRGNGFRVNSNTTFGHNSPVAAMDAAGDFTIAMWGNGEDGSGYGIYAQRYDSGGTAQGTEFKVNTYTTGNQLFAAIAMDQSGDFVVDWGSNGQDGSLYGIYGQHYRADVAPLLSQIETNPLKAIAASTTIVTSSVLVFDQDSAIFTGATVQITSNYQSNQDVLGFVNTAKIKGSWNAATGKLTLTGSDTISNYRSALRTVTYHDTSGAPDTALPRTITFQANDGLLTSNLVSRKLLISAVNSPPVLSGVSGTGIYVENAVPQLLAPSLAISDAETPTIESATVALTNWQAEDRIDFNNLFGLQHSLIQDLAAHTAALTITGIDTLAHYQTLLRSVEYWDVSNNPITTARVAKFAVDDGISISNLVARTVTVTAVNDAPVLSAIEAAPLAYKANDPAFPPLPISATLVLGDPDSLNITKATVQITTGFQHNASGQDVLSFTNQLGITGSYNSATGLLTLTGTSSGSNYRTALCSVKFSTSGTAVSTANRTLTITATDDFSPTHATSLSITRQVTVLTTNVKPGLGGISAVNVPYVRGSAPTTLVPDVTVVDPDSINMTLAIIKISANYDSGQDVLAFTPGFGVTGSFTVATGILKLVGVTSKANYETLLQSVTFKTNTATASTAQRTVTFIVGDGLVLGTPNSCQVALT